MDVVDAGRLGELVDRHASALELYARQWCEAPEDVVQEAFVALAGLGREPENPGAWLFRVVRNGAINAGKAARRRKTHEARAAVGAGAWFEADSGDRIGPERAEEELRGLPIEQREVIVAKVWGGLTFEQIGGLTGRSSSAAHRVYQAGLQALRERLGVPCRDRK